MRRFYFADGRVDRVRVDEMSGPPPRHWTIREFPPRQWTSPTFRMPPRPGFEHAIERCFHRRDYRYSEGFIGPHRDSDYHEESSR